MKYTHDSYETSVVNPECDPQDYNPANMYHNAPSWFAQAETRDGYEQICAQCGVTPHSDSEIKAHGYGLMYAEYSREEWLRMSRDERILHKLDRVRLQAVEAEEKARVRELAQRRAQQMVMVRCSCGHTVPQSQVMSASKGTSCPDCYDRMSE
jgi:hypothetical protein